MRGEIEKKLRDVAVERKLLYTNKTMNTTISISLPESLDKTVDKEVLHGSFESKSIFFQTLVKLWMENKLSHELHESKEELIEGKGTLLRSLKDLR